jgi:hypothetical protein
VPLASAVARQTPGIEVFGSLALNRAVGGLNVEAIEKMAAMEPGRARIVWMPTFDSENQARTTGRLGPFVAVSRNGKLLPETLAVLDAIAAANLALATGHLTPGETLHVIAEARRRGIDRILLTHPTISPVNMTMNEMKQAAAQGAYVELVCNVLQGPSGEAELRQYAEIIREIGADRVILSSDLGQADTPLHPDGLAAAMEGLHKLGTSIAELDRITKTNPARLLQLR